MKLDNDTFENTGKSIIIIFLGKTRKDAIL